MIEKKRISQDDFSQPEEENENPSKDFSQCSLPNKIPLFLVDQRSSFIEPKSLQMKERLFASKRLKSIGQQMQKWVEQRFQRLEEAKPLVEEGKE